MIKNLLKIIFIYLNFKLNAGPNISKESTKNFIISSSLVVNYYLIKRNDDLYKIIKNIEDKNKQKQIEIYCLKNSLIDNNNANNNSDNNNKKTIDYNEFGIIFLSGAIGGYKLNNFFK